MAKFQITPCTTADGSAIAKVNIMAFWTEPTWVHLWRGRTQEYMLAQYCRRTPHTILMDRPHRRHQQVIDTETGTVVGYSRWTLPDFKVPNLDYDTLWPEAQVPPVKPEQAQFFQAEHKAADFNPNKSLYGLDEPADAIMEKLEVSKPYIQLEVLGVLPEYWRKGIASMLVEDAIREFEALPLPAGIEVDILIRAKKPALGVYKRAGFVIVDQIIQDASHLGVEGGEYGAYFLTRAVERKENSVKEKHQ